MDLVCQFLLVTIYCLVLVYLLFRPLPQDVEFNGSVPGAELSTSVWLGPMLDAGRSTASEARQPGR